MKTTSVTAHYERKLNTGNYSSVTLSAWATVEVEEGDTEGEALQYAMNLCREEVKDAAGPFVKKSAAHAPKQPAGAPVRKKYRDYYDDHTEDAYSIH